MNTGEVVGIALGTFAVGLTFGYVLRIFVEFIEIARASMPVGAPAEEGTT